MSVQRKMRLSQTVAPFGVGAIFDVLGESFVASDITRWGQRGDVLRLRRLEQELGVARFRAAPSSASRFAKDLRGVPFARFPKVLFCPRCRSVVFWRISHEVEGEPARCGCPDKALLVPMRFVSVCRNGHMHDVPWREWAHSHARTPDQKQCNSFNLALLSSSGGGAGLESLAVFCRKCKARRSLAGISSKDSLNPMEAKFPEAVRCRGTQPWERADAGEKCGELLQIVQRGATNVYFANVESAIDIPPGSDYDAFSELALKIKGHPNFPAIVNAPSGPATPILISAIASELGCDEDDVVAALQEEVLGAESQAETLDEVDILTGEWRAFTGPDRDFHPKARFVKESVQLIADSDPPPVLAALDALVDRVEVAPRLREVRALVSFARYEPTARRVRADLGAGRDWLPAIEVYGEGIFLSLEEERVSEWEKATTQVGNLLEERRHKSLVGGRLPEVTSRYVLLHTVSHLLIRQLVFECGYSAAALRERIYSRTPEQGEPQAGLLIYTAAGDVEGTMGGLVRQGRPPRLATTLLRALERGSWCSTDPLCRENPGQGFGSLNLAACHACCLLPETSCETGNKLLDRSLVVGNEELGLVGFFSGVIESAVNLAPPIGVD